jgi:hypothetical protein
MKLKMELREKLKVKNLNEIHSNTISNYQYQTYLMFGDLKKLMNISQGSGSKRKI